jgi:hypothetical protein
LYIAVSDGAVYRGEEISQSWMLFNTTVELPSIAVFHTAVLKRLTTIVSN